MKCKTGKCQIDERMKPIRWREGDRNAHGQTWEDIFEDDKPEKPSSNGATSRFDFET